MEVKEAWTVELSQFLVLGGLSKSASFAASRTQLRRKVTMHTRLIAVLVTCIALSAGCTMPSSKSDQPAPPASQKAAIVGTWESRWGLVTILSDGTGSYPHQESTLHGEISEDGRRWSGQWKHHKTDTKTGGAVFEVTDDDRLVGRYWSGSLSERNKGDAWPGGKRVR